MSKFYKRINQVVINREIPEFHDISFISNIRKADKLKYKGIYDPLDLKGLINIGGTSRRVILPRLTNIWEVL